MKKLIAFVMTLVLAVSLAAMASAANTQDLHDHDCADCVGSIQRSTTNCINSRCGSRPLMYVNNNGDTCNTSYYDAQGNKKICTLNTSVYYCNTCGWNYFYCSRGHLQTF